MINAKIMPNLNCMAFIYRGFGYMLDYTYVRPYSWTNSSWPSAPIRGGEKIFTAEEVKLIKMWRNADGYAGLTIEEFLEVMNGVK